MGTNPREKQFGRSEPPRVPDPEALEGIPVALALLDREARVLWRNPSWVNLAPAQEQFLQSPAVRSRIREAFREGRMLVLRSVALREEEYYDLWVSPLSEDLGWVACVDVSVYAHKHGEERVQQGMNTAIMVLQGMIHEIRNPLAALHALSQLLQKTLGYDPKGYIQEIRDTVKRVDRLLLELTSFTGPVRLRLEPTNIHTILDDVLRHTQPLLEERRIRVVRDFDPSIPEIRVDSNRLFRAILNLVQNAIEASPPGSPLELKTRVDPFERFTGPAVVIEIRDYGKGITREVESRLFTPFFTTKPQGTGLGLAIAFHFIREHGGSLTLTNHLEGGAIARVLLPFEPRA